MKPLRGIRSSPIMERRLAAGKATETITSQTAIAAVNALPKTEPLNTSKLFTTETSPVSEPQAVKVAAYEEKITNENGELVPPLCWILLGRAIR